VTVPRTVWWKRTATVNTVIAIVLFIVAFATYFSGNETTAFHPDESRWLNRAHYIGDVLDPFGPTWNDQYLSRGQPPIGSYVMGIGLLLQGRDLDTNLAWDFRRSDQFNRANGMFPQQGDWMAGRRTNNVIGALAVVVVFFIATRLTNQIGGVVASLLLIINPLQSWHNRLALADTALTLTLALLMLCSIQLVRRPGWGWAIAAGVLIGIGGANKFTPISLCAPLALLGAIMLVRDWRASRQLDSRLLAGWRGWPPFTHLGWMLLSTPIVAGATFVLVYPYLWPDPIGRTLKLLEFRTAEMTSQNAIDPSRAIANPIEAAQRTWTFLGHRWSGTREFFRLIGLPDVGHALSQLDVWLALVGLVVLAWLAWRKGLQSPHLIVWLLIVTEIATIIVSMKTDFERYYLPIVLGFVVASGVAVGFLSDKIMERMRTRSVRKPVARHEAA